MPPRVAPIQAVIVPIIFEQSKKVVLDASHNIKHALETHGYDIHLDDREEYSPGWKFNEWELKGVPLRIELGPKDLEKHQCVIVRRDTGKKEFVNLANVKDAVKSTLDQMHNDMLAEAKLHLDANLAEARTMDDLVKHIKDKHMTLVPFCGEAGCEEYIKEATEGAVSRCSPFGKHPQAGMKCVQCGKDAKTMTYFARAY